MGRQRAGQKLRYYVYISDSKLDMLFEQIDRSILKRVSAEVKVDIKIASITLREADQPGATRIAKLRVVERFLEENHTIGSIQKPGREYFRGKMDMEWGWTGGDDSGVWFEGNDFNEGQYVGLGGSRYHVLSESPQGRLRKHANSGTAAPSIIRALEDSGFFLDTRIRNSELSGELPGGWQGYVSRRPYVPRSGHIPPQHLEFLAVPLAETYIDSGEPAPVHVVIGTPLYVASAGH